MARGRSSGSSKGSLIQRPFTGGSWPKTMVRSMNSTGRQYPLVPGTIFHRGHDWNTIRDTMPFGHEGSAIRERGIRIWEVLRLRGPGDENIPLRVYCQPSRNIIATATEIRREQQL